MSYFFRHALWLAAGLLPTLAAAQPSDYARRLVDHLASPELDGRGYVDYGHQRAAEYLEEEMRTLGMQPLFDGSYRHQFMMTANAFPDVLELDFAGQDLVPGRDYLVHAGSPSHRRKSRITYFDISETTWDPNALVSTLSQAEGDWIMVDADSLKKYDAAGLGPYLAKLKYPIAGVIELVSDKLTWAPATEQLRMPVLYIRKQSLTKPLSRLNKIDFELSAEFDRQPAYNLGGYIPAQAVTQKSLVLMAHYDHLGRMGANTLFPGANDNASGVAAALDIARRFAADLHPTHNIVVLLFAGEEAGLLGSKAFAEQHASLLGAPSFYLNLDICGTGQEGLGVVNGTMWQAEQQALQALNEQVGNFTTLKWRDAACNSDHCFFHQLGMRGFYLYTLGGKQAYHDIDDTAEGLPLARHEDLVLLCKAFLDQY